MAASVAEARTWTDINPDHVMVKVAATEEGYKIIEDVIATGRNVNATLIFTEDQYEKVAEAYIAGLERALAAGHDLRKIYSVASFFVSRWDVALAKSAPEKLQGEMANAVAIAAYHRIFMLIFNSKRFEKLRSNGARVQDFLVASTGSKADDMVAKGIIPEGFRRYYPPLIYVEPLIGANVVNTLPLNTIKSMIEKGVRVSPTISDTFNYDHALMVLGDMDKIANIDEAGRKLFDAGMKNFSADFATVMKMIDDAIGNSAKPQRKDNSTSVEKAGAETELINQAEATARLNALPTISSLENLTKFYEHAVATNMPAKDILETLKPELAKMAQILRAARPNDELDRLLGMNLGIKQRQLDILRGASEFILQFMPDKEGVDNPTMLANIKKTFVGNPEISKLLIEFFETKFNPEEELIARGEAAYEKRQEIVKRLKEINGDDHNILELAKDMIFATVKTDYYVEDRIELAFRMDPKVVQGHDHTGVFGHAPPYGIIWVHVPYGAFGAHSRYDDVARGGLRSIRPDRTRLLNKVLSECRALSMTQSNKHPDIPEDGSKGTFIYQKDLNFVAAAIGYVDGLINCMMSGDGIMVAAGGQEIDPLELGPDEGTAEITSLITARAWMKKLDAWRILISGKLEALGGTSHMENNFLTPARKGNRVTSQGVMVHAVEMVRYLREKGRIESKEGEPIRFSIIGGLRGDVASGLAEIAINHYGDNAKVLTMSDSSAVIFDPEGLDHATLLEMYDKKLQCKNFPIEKLHKGGFVVEVKEGAAEDSYVELGLETLRFMNMNALNPKLLRELGADVRFREQAKIGPNQPLIEILKKNSGGYTQRVKVHSAYLRDAIFFMIKSDMLLTGGGVKDSINDTNWKLFFDEYGNPTAPSIVHGANVFITKQANINLEKRIVIEPDEKANSVGVEISSRMEVDFNTIFAEDEITRDRMKAYFEQVLAKCLENAERKFWALRIEAENAPDKSVVTNVSPRMSQKVIHLAKLIKGSHLVGDRRDSYSDTMISYLKSYFPDISSLDKKYYSTLERVFARMPSSRIKAIASKLVAKEAVLNLGIDAVSEIAKATGKNEIEVIEEYLKVADGLGINKNVREIIENKPGLAPSAQIKAFRALRDQAKSAILSNLKGEKGAKPQTSLSLPAGFSTDTYEWLGNSGMVRNKGTHEVWRAYGERAGSWIRACVLKPQDVQALTLIVTKYNIVDTPDNIVTLQEVREGIMGGRMYPEEALQLLGSVGIKSEEIDSAVAALAQLDTAAPTGPEFKRNSTSVEKPGPGIISLEDAKRVIVQSGILQITVFGPRDYRREHEKREKKFGLEPLDKNWERAVKRVLDELVESGFLHSVIDGMNANGPVMYQLSQASRDEIEAKSKQSFAKTVPALPIKVVASIIEPNGISIRISNISLNGKSDVVVTAVGPSDLAGKLNANFLSMGFEVSEINGIGVLIERTFPEGKKFLQVVDDMKDMPILANAISYMLAPHMPYRVTRSLRAFTSFPENAPTSPQFKDNSTSVEKPESDQDANGIIKMLSKALRLEDWEMCAKVSEMLGEVRPVSEKSVRALMKAYENKEWPRREEALWALGHMGFEARAAIPLIIEALKARGQGTFSTVFAMYAAGEIGPAGTEEEKKALIAELKKIEEEYPNEKTDVAARNSITKIEIVSHASVSDTEDETGRVAAQNILGDILGTIKEKGQAVVLFASAPSQHATWKHFIDLKNRLTPENQRLLENGIIAFHMDEYLGIDRRARQVFANVLEDKFFSKIGIKEENIFYFDSSVGYDTAVKLKEALKAGHEKTAARLAAKLEKEVQPHADKIAGKLNEYGGIFDLEIGGIGENGHLGFNDAPGAKFKDPKVIKVVRLSEESRKQQVKDGEFSTLAKVPTHAITFSLTPMLSARHIHVVVPRKSKAEAVRKTLDEQASESVPASGLKLKDVLPKVSIYLDRKSASESKVAQLALERQEHPQSKKVSPSVEKPLIAGEDSETGDADDISALLPDQLTEAGMNHRALYDTLQMADVAKVPVVGHGRVLIFSEKATFGYKLDNGQVELGVGVVLKKFAESGTKIAVIATTETERQLIQKINEGISDRERKIIVEGSVLDIKTQLSGIKHFYYYKLESESAPDEAGVTVVNIIARKILEALGRICGVPADSMPRLYEAARKFAEAA